MHTGLAQVRNEFPGLSYCELVNQSLGHAGFPASGLNLALLEPWIKWFLRTDPFDWIRVRIRQNQDLIICRLDQNYLFILNETESLPLLIGYLEKLRTTYSTPASSAPTPGPEKPLSHMDLKILDAVRIQRMIIPKEEDIRKSFKKFFVVHQQQDLVGGDFYWYRQHKDSSIIALVDCTGHSIEGAMSSMVCNSLLNQAMSDFDPTNLTTFVSSFYAHLKSNNGDKKAELDYGIGAELAVFCFNTSSNDVRFVSTGVRAAMKKSTGEIEFLRPKKLLEVSAANSDLEQLVIPISEISSLYVFTDGLTDQFDSNDKKKLGRKGLKKIIEQERSFDSSYYGEEINKWRGSNYQYDDITLLGMVI